MRLAIAAVLSLCVAGAPAALATPLDKGACESLKIERDTLSQKGVPTDMERGPVWAKTNLPTERMTEIARFIEIDEQLMFRCGRSTAQPGGKQSGKPKAAKDEPGKRPKDKSSADKIGVDDDTAPAAAAGTKPVREKIAKETEATPPAAPASPVVTVPATAAPTPPSPPPAAAATPPTASAAPPAATVAPPPVKPKTTQRKKKPANDDFFPFFAP